MSSLRRAVALWQPLSRALPAWLAHRPVLASVAAFSAAGLAAVHADVATGRSLFAHRFEGNVGPRADRRPHTIAIHGDERVDFYYWIRDDKREDPDVLALCKEENAHCSAAMAGTEDLQATLFKEMRSRIQEDEATAPERSDGYYYYTRYVEGEQYPVQCRRKLKQGTNAPYAADSGVDDTTCEAEEVLLDENAEAKASKGDFYMVSAFRPSPSHRFIAYAEDTTGDEVYCLRILDTAHGTIRKLPDVIPKAAARIAWGDENTLFYLTQDSQHRPDKIWRHTLGNAVEADQLVLHEPDEAFSVGVRRSRSGDYLYCSCHSAVTSDVRFLPTTHLNGTPVPIFGRTQNVEYSVEDRNHRFYVSTNADGAFNAKIVAIDAKDVDGTCTHATEVVPHRADARIEDITLFSHFFTYTERVNSNSQLRVQPFSNSSSHELVVQMSEEAYCLWVKSSEFQSPILRYGYSSLTTPMSVFDVDMRDLSAPAVLKKMQPVLGNFKREDYVSERLWATSHDGVRVPISLVRRRDLPAGPAPVHLAGYGSYELSYDCIFSRNELSLLNRGVVCAIAHVRGGGEMGRLWYENGKYKKKENTWRDFVACAEHLVNNGIADPDRLTIEGRSAGGLLIGATLNTAPKRPDGRPFFAGAIAGVPFVDVLTTMLDETIPLTVVEWEEWGNPNLEDFYHYMKSYSPVDQVSFRHGPYPPVLIKGGLHDPRVGYWEPMKYAQRLRDEGARTVLCKIDLGAGHFSQSGRFDKLKDVALDYAFLLRCLGLEAEAPKA